MKNDKFCINRTLGYLVLLVLVVTGFYYVMTSVNTKTPTSNEAKAYSNCTTITGNALAFCKNTLSSCGSGYGRWTTTTKCSLMGTCCVPNNWLTPTPIPPPPTATPIPLTRPTSVEQITGICEGIINKVARVYADYGGPGVNACIKFTGQYYSTRTKNPSVLTPLSGSPLSQYCTTGAITYSCAAAVAPVATVENLTAICQGIIGKVAKTYADYGGPGSNACVKFNGNYYSTTNKNPSVPTALSGVPLSQYCATGAITSSCATVVPVTTVENLTAICQGISGRVARTYADYGGPGVNACIKFNGNYYSTTNKNPSVTTALSGQPQSQFCATGSITYDCLE